ncbi:hypothetical protein C7123_11145 [Tannerella serpentiformis]|nr:hypothetical protein BCB71_03660 [Tannerella serpentiformis]AVV54201.1 hypothetical protein C7123_11145 [Tannerella serpentiformis]
MEGLCRGWGKVELDQTGACLALHKMQGPKQLPVYSRADWSAPNRRLFAFPKLLRFEDGIMVAQKALSGEQRGIAAGQRPDKDFGRLFTFASDKGFLE